MENQLINLEQQNMFEVFTNNGLDPLLNKIAEEAKNVKFDVSTQQGRDGLKSHAYNVSRSKTYLIKKADEITEDWKKQTKLVVTEKKKAERFLDDLKNEVRQPLTDFEGREKERVEQLKLSVEKIQILSNPPITIGEEPPIHKLEKSLAELEATVVDESWAEFQYAAMEYRSKGIGRLESMIKDLKEKQAERAELEKFRKEKEEREKKEHEDKIRKEAAEQAAKETEARELHKQNELRRKEQEAKDRAVAAEKREQEAAQKAKRDQEFAVIRAKEDERRLAAAKIAKQESEQLRRDTDLAHRKVINNGILEALAKYSIDSDNGKKLIQAIVKGEILHVSIKY